MKIKEFLFTAFYAGYSPVAPGTAGTFVAMALYIAENYLLGDILNNSLNYINFIVLLLLVYPSIKLCDEAEPFYKSKDPQRVVIDEVMGYWTGLLFLPFSITYAILAFIIFRIFDILKPYPAKRLEKLHGGLGIMIDDYVAGLYTLAVMHLVAFFLESKGIILF
ncbi:MAG TPA: phosphatidylglycerophosphatase A [Spirochaetota bacterium]|nr:phosphatidylglycerophosphatase A [Spirochaetota bacterium]